MNEHHRKRTGLNFRPWSVLRRRDRRSRLSRGQRLGAAAVEFAVVAPVFFLLVFGMIEFGRMIMVQQLLTNAVREGARIAVVDGSTNSDVMTKVDDYLSGASLDSQDVTIDVDPGSISNSETGDAITVEASVAYVDVGWLPSPWFLADRVLTASCTMRRE